jgi:hypothetical protein
MNTIIEALRIGIAIAESERQVLIEENCPYNCESINLLYGKINGLSKAIDTIRQQQDKGELTVREVVEYLAKNKQSHDAGYTSIKLFNDYSGNMIASHLLSDIDDKEIAEFNSLQQLTDLVRGR